jgi:hypothetical protein
MTFERVARCDVDRIKPTPYWQMILQRSSFRIAEQRVVVAAPSAPRQRSSPGVEAAGIDNRASDRERPHLGLERRKRGACDNNARPAVAVTRTAVTSPRLHKRPRR